MTRFTAGHALVAADFAGLDDPWNDYTPTLGVITIGNGSITARYSQVGSTVLLRVRIQWGTTTTTAAGTLLIGLPVPPEGSYVQHDALGAAVLSGVTRRSGVAVFSPSSVFVIDNDTGGTVTNAVPWTWANGHVLAFQGAYEAS